ncbi:polyprenyl synthetase family protein [Micromonospora sp. WMMD1120]|uniref:polyprenyl synthetase family protein n=1 Tax=Micromonospora sp. WMMD1120 TaxID=3016106 RepID=UPI0024167A9B|nr:polyprenyl synthetase family protein [Micromonospora sp. WMMD1120]MDG4807332.1 polyprenyl synthetase family protein [Micromonospora sp. WMMD1120]
MVDSVVNPAGERSGVAGSGGQRGRASTSQFGALGLNFDEPRVEASVLGLLDAVEVELRASVSSADPFVNEAARHLVEAGGKRLRPLLVALGAQFGDPTAPKVVPAAVVMELTHLATLYHDDVMDEAAVRRGAQSANSRWTNSVAILVGDYLFARAADIAADLGPEAVRLQARTFARLVHGQIAETVGPRAEDDPVAHYLHVIGEKTGSLIATSVRFGGLFAGAAPEHVEALAGYGETIGVAFQLSDDLLDIASESVQSGKTPGTDLREGVPTLPVLYALEADDSDASSVRLREILATGPLTDDALHSEALGLLRESPALKRARETVRGYAEEARAQLAPLPVGPERSALESLCDYMADRNG